ncbi:MAG: hypothetical protein MHMPM18_001916 [Marteilia pararefringens]
MPLITNANSLWSDEQLEEIVGSCINEKIGNISCINRIMDMLSIIFHSTINQVEDNSTKRSVGNVLKNFVESFAQVDEDDEMFKNLAIMRYNVAKFLLKFLSPNNNSESMFPVDIASLKEYIFQNQQFNDDQFFTILLNRDFEQISQAPLLNNVYFTRTKKSLITPPNSDLNDLVEERLRRLQKKEKNTAASRSLLDKSMYKYEKFISGNQNNKVNNQTSPSYSGTYLSNNNILHKSTKTKDYNTVHYENNNNNMSLDSTTKSNIGSNRLRIAQSFSKKSKIKMVDAHEIEKAKKEKRKNSTSTSKSITKSYSLSSEDGQKHGNQQIIDSPIRNSSDNNTETSDIPMSPLSSLSAVSFQSSGMTPNPSSPIAPSVPNNLSKLPDLNYNFSESKKIQNDSLEPSNETKSIEDNSDGSNRDKLIEAEIRRIISLSKNLTAVDKEMISVFFKGMTQNPTNPKMPNYSIVLNRSLKQENSDRSKMLVLDMNYETGEYNIYES